MNLFSTLCFTWFMIVFCISGLFINFLQLLVLPLYWIKRDWYHIIIPGLAYGIFSRMLSFFLKFMFLIFLSGMVTNTIDELGVQSVPPLNLFYKKYFFLNIKKIIKKACHDFI